MPNTGEFVNPIIPQSSKFDFVVVSMSINAAELTKWLETKKDHIQENNGFIRVDVLRSKKNPAKLYSFHREIKKKEVTNAEQNEGRDLPF